MSEENVLVIPATRLDILGQFSGFRPFEQTALDALLSEQFMEFRPRSQVEEDPTFKQLIPYAILVHETGSERFIFQYTRGKGQGEKRLHALKSIGIGGHISREDAEGGDLYRSGMLRELSEEMIIDTDYEDELVGFIYDDTTEVGRVHLGVVHLLRMPSTAARAREIDLEGSGFQPLSTIKQDLERYETWSKLCLHNLFS